MAHLGLSLAHLTDQRPASIRLTITILKGIGAAIALSTLISLFVYRLSFGMHTSIPLEITRYTSTSLFDLVIAAIGGTAAAYATAHSRLKNVFPGVAIATALISPLCVIGFGIATLNIPVVFGAILQFLVNYTAIALCATLAFAFFGFLPKKAK
ncbi:MAG: DUF389 domain-containing protein [Anaerolineaceae bacterium]|nr:DUF389 domain-containing protein [Anaerolineaceae bacterium]